MAFHCADDATCPRIVITGDPPADDAAHYFRGYGDPSLETDPVTGEIWLAYSWLDTEPPDPARPLVRDRQVHTHLARSTDDGETFTFVKAVNGTTRIAHPVTSEIGWTEAEVPTLVRRPVGDWMLLYLEYFDPFGEVPGDFRDFHYVREIAATPNALGTAPERHIRGRVTPAAYRVTHDLSATIAELADCAIFTEPLLFAHQSRTWLATTCLVLDGSGARDIARERIVLLQALADGYR